MPDSSRAAHSSPDAFENLANTAVGRVPVATISAGPVRTGSEEPLGHLVALHGTERMGDSMRAVEKARMNEARLQRGGWARRRRSA